MKLMNYDAARDSFQAMLEAYNRAAKLAHDDAEIDTNLRLANIKLAEALKAQHGPKAALVHHKAALAAAKGQADAHPGPTVEQWQAMTIETQIGAIEMQQGWNGDFATHRALAAYSAALDRTDAVLKLQPSNELWLAEKGFVLEMVVASNS